MTDSGTTGSRYKQMRINAPKKFTKKICRDILPEILIEYFLNTIQAGEPMVVVAQLFLLNPFHASFIETSILLSGVWVPQSV
jgi:hypothetical protein